MRINLINLNNFITKDHSGGVASLKKKTGLHLRMCFPHLFRHNISSVPNSFPAMGKTYERGIF